MLYGWRLSSQGLGPVITPVGRPTYRTHLKLYHYLQMTFLDKDHHMSYDGTEGILPSD